MFQSIFISCIFFLCIIQLILFFIIVKKFKILLKIKISRLRIHLFKILAPNPKSVPPVTNPTQNSIMSFFKLLFLLELLLLEHPLTSLCLSYYSISDSVLNLTNYFDYIECLVARRSFDILGL